jgi:general secretion pathway protein G
MRRLLIVVAAVFVLAGAFAAWQFKKNIEMARQQARVNALHEELAGMRAAIAKFHADNGRYPHTLIELMPKYLPVIPIDPMTGAADTWRLTTEETVEPSEDFRAETGAKSEPVIVDVHSSAPGYSND